MACRPSWFVDQGRNLHPPAGSVTVNIPPGFEALETPTRAAAASLTAGLGIQIDVVLNQPCTGGRCVTVNENYVSDPGNPGCADFAGGSVNEQGEWTTTGTIRLMPAWRTAHPTRMQRHMSHELAHFFGLWNRVEPPCSYQNTLMSAPPAGSGCYESTEPPSDMALGPTASDLAALRASPYGNQNRKICGYE